MNAAILAASHHTRYFSFAGISTSIWLDFLFASHHIHSSVSQVGSLMHRFIRSSVARRCFPGNAASILVTAACHLPPLQYSLRVCSTSSSSNATSSAVNVEAFTLNDEVVQRDLDYIARWNAISAAIDAARGADDHKAILAEVEKGLELLGSVGNLNAPIQCECLLCMEAAQAHYNLHQYEAALEKAEQARRSLTEGGSKEELLDRAQMAEIDQFIGFTLCKHRKPKEAQERLAAVLHWIDVDAKSAMPMQAVAAVNLRRSVLTGVGQSQTLQAAELAEQDETAEARELFGKALDTLIEALNQHIDENDFTMVKTTLSSILMCFEGLGDISQAVVTCRKFISWCDRHEDAAGVVEGKSMLGALCAKHNLPNPLDEEEKGAAVANASGAGPESTTSSS